MPKATNIDTLSKILAQAENAGTEAEGKNFMERATNMAQTLGVSLDVARAHAAKAERKEPEQRTYEVGAWNSRYNKYMVELFCAVAEPFDMKISVGGRDIYVHATGFPHDHEIVNALWQVAAVRMVSDANAALKRGEQKNVGRYGVDGRIYRAHFYEGYTSTLRARMYEERRKAREQAEREGREWSSPYMNDGDSGMPSMALVISDKKKSIEDAYRAAHPHWFHPDGRRKQNVATYKSPERDDFVLEAQKAGSNSARKVDLTPDKSKVTAANRKAIEG